MTPTPLLAHGGEIIMVVVIAVLGAAWLSGSVAAVLGVFARSRRAARWAIVCGAAAVVAIILLYFVGRKLPDLREPFDWVALAPAALGAVGIAMGVIRRKD